jgi:D-aminopeptidase
MNSTWVQNAPHIGTLPAGPLGTIADVPGVTVGHCTLDQGAVQTGVTVIRFSTRCRRRRR